MLTACQSDIDVHIYVDVVSTLCYVSTVSQRDVVVGKSLVRRLGSWLVLY